MLERTDDFPCTYRKAVAEILMAKQSVYVVVKCLHDDPFEVACVFSNESSARTFCDEETTNLRDNWKHQWQCPYKFVCLLEEVRP